jgi:hypothetical protein
LVLKLNGLIKIVGVYVITFLILLISSFLLFPIIDTTITYRVMLIENYFLFMLSIPLSIIHVTGIISKLISAYLILGITIPVALSKKTNKLFPYIILFIVTVLLWLFIGFIVFGIRNGE